MGDSAHPGASVSRVSNSPLAAGRSALGSLPRDRHGGRPTKSLPPLAARHSAHSHVTVTEGAPQRAPGRRRGAAAAQSAAPVYIVGQRSNQASAPDRKTLRSKAQELSKAVGLSSTRLHLFFFSGSTVASKWRRRFHRRPAFAASAQAQTARVSQLCR